MTAEPQVVLAYCHNGDVRGDWAECYAELRLIDSYNRRLLDPTKRPIIFKGLYIHRNRNQACKVFREQRTEPWLMFLDTDMMFTAGQFYALYEEAVRHGPGVHAGLYYGIYGSEGTFGNGQIRAPHGAIDIRANWMRKVDGRVEWVADRRLAARDDLSACGMGFTLIHREVIDALAEKRPRHANAWFGHDEMTDSETGEIDDAGEDATFCDRVTALGFKIFGHDSIALGHDKRILLTWEHYDYEQRRLRDGQRA